MGLRSGSDLYSTKFINAEIDDSGGERHVVPIKHVYDNYFFVKIKKELYCFEIDYRSVKTRRGVGFKTIDYLNYDTTHFRPINEKCKELELILKKNSLPNINAQMYKTFKILGAREKKNFEKHDIKELIGELKDYETIDPEKFGNLITFLKDLEVEEIVTPLRSVSEFLENDLKTTRPAFLGSIASRLISLDGVHQLVTNAPITARRDWIKLMVIVMAVGLVLSVVYIGYTEGWFDSITSITDSLGDFEFDISGTPPGDRGGDPFLKKYPTPAAAKAALDRGEISESDIPPNMRELVKNVKTPSVEPKQ